MSSTSTGWCGCGVPFKPVFWGEPGWEPPADEGLMFTGGENAYPFNTIATPAPRGHVPQMANKRAGEASAGYMLMKPLVDTATSLGVRSIYDMHVQSLVVQSDGRVAGLLARQYGKTLAVRARRGVVLASGSFAYNDAMVAQYAPRIVGRPAASIEQHDGQAIRMAQALGADLAHMDATEVAFLIDPQQTVRGILVNGRGQRYVPEDMYSGRIGQLTLYHQDDTAYLIIDGDAQEEAMAATSATPFLKRPADVGLRDGRRARIRDRACRPVRCSPPSAPTTPPPSTARIRCCTRSRNGASRSAHRSARSICAPAAPGSPSAGC